MGVYNIAFVLGPEPQVQSHSGPFLAGSLVSRADLDAPRTNLVGMDDWQGGAIRSNVLRGGDKEAYMSDDNNARSMARKKPQHSALEMMKRYGEGREEGSGPCIESVQNR